MSNVPDESGYLFVVNYDSDAERKRVEYLFNSWEEGRIRTPDGIVRIAEDIDHDALYEQLVSKVPDDQVESYQLEETDPDLEGDTVTIEQYIDAPRDAVESFLNYVLSKRNAVLQSASHNEYEVYSKKGRAEVRYRLSDADGGTEVWMQVSGYPPAPGFLGEFFETELSDYAEGQA